MKFSPATAAAILFLIGSTPAHSQAAVHCCIELPSGSMLPTIPPRVPLQHSPYASPADVRRGDILLFLASKSNQRLVKRLIGLPGDRIQMRAGQVIINDQPVPRIKMGPFRDQGTVAPQWEETLPEGITHMTVDLVDKSFFDDTPVYTVPAGSYFFMGDNRDHSTDSRALSQVGYVPFGDIIGRVTVR